MFKPQNILTNSFFFIDIRGTVVDKIMYRFSNK